MPGIPEGKTRTRELVSHAIGEGAGSPGGSSHDKVTELTPQDLRKMPDRRAKLRKENLLFITFHDSTQFPQLASPFLQEGT